MTSAFQDQDVLVTGGAGFIGSHLVDRLHALGARVTVLDDVSAGDARNLALAPRARVVRGRVEDVARLLDARFDVVFHVAANASVPKSVDDPVRDFASNAAGTLALLEYVRAHDCGPVVYASTAAVYGEPVDVPIREDHPLAPVSPYGASKLAGERAGVAYERTYGVPFHPVRIFNTYGPRQPRYVMHDLMVKLMRNPRELEVLGTGEQVRDYCYVTDMVDAFLLVAERGGGPFNVAGGHPVVLRDLVDRIVTLVAPGARVRYGGETWAGDITRLVASIDRIRDLGFQPKVGLDDGLQRLYASLRERHAAPRPRAVA